MKYANVLLLLSVLILQTAAAQISATVNGTSVTIADNNFQWSCSGVFHPIVTRRADTLFVVERDTMPATTCTCQHTVVTTSAGLSPGSYTAMVYRQRLYRIVPPIDTIITITLFAGSVPFTIVQNSPGTELITSFLQAGCGISPGGVSEQGAAVPLVFDLTAHPNPFNPHTTIAFTLQHTGLTTLRVYDAAGQEVSTLVNEVLGAGIRHQKVFDGRHLASGVYYGRLVSGEQAMTVKVMLLK